MSWDSRKVILVGPELLAFTIVVFLLQRGSRQDTSRLMPEYDLRIDSPSH